MKAYFETIINYKWNNWIGLFETLFFFYKTRKNVKKLTKLFWNTIIIFILIHSAKNIKIVLEKKICRWRSDEKNQVQYYTLI